MFFFFKQKTAYEMRISDWSSDVCSSDLAEAGRTFDDVDLIIPVFAIPGDTPEERSALIERTRFQIAFYGSTKNYAFQFDDLGFEGTSARINEKLKAGDLPGMAALITDEMLEHYAVIARWADPAPAPEPPYGPL